MKHVARTVFTLIIFQSSIFGQWLESNFSPQFGSLTELEFPAKTVAYALAGGEIHKSTDAGLTWSMIYDEGPFSNMSDLHFLNADTGFVKSWGTNLRTTDGGANWTPMTWYYDLEVVDGILYTSYLSNDTSYIAESTDFGDHWTILLQQYKVDNKAFQVSFLNSNTAYFIAPNEPEQILLTTDRFASIDTIPIVPNEVIPQQKFKFKDMANGYFYGTHGTSYPSRTWFGNDVAVFYDMDIDGFGVLPVLDMVFNTTKLYASSLYGKIYLSNSNGENGTWVEQNTPLSDPINSIAFYNDDIGIAASHNKILYTNNGGLLNVEKLPSLETSIKIYPIPSQSIIFLKNQLKQTLDLELIDGSGKQVYPEFKLTQKKYSLDISNLPKGNYFLHLTTGKQMGTVKVIKN